MWWHSEQRCSAAGTQLQQIIKSSLQFSDDHALTLNLLLRKDIIGNSHCMHNHYRQLLQIKLPVELGPDLHRPALMSIAFPLHAYTEHATSHNQSPIFKVISRTVGRSFRIVHNIFRGFEFLLASLSLIIYQSREVHSHELGELATDHLTHYDLVPALPRPPSPSHLRRRILKRELPRGGRRPEGPLKQARINNLGS